MNFIANDFRFDKNNWQRQTLSIIVCNLCLSHFSIFSKHTNSTCVPTLQENKMTKFSVGVSLSHKDVQPNLRVLSSFWAHMTLIEFNYSSLKECWKNSADHTKTILLNDELIQAPGKIAGGKFHWNQIASQHYVSHYKVIYDSRTKARVQVEGNEQNLLKPGPGNRNFKGLKKSLPTLLKQKVAGTKSREVAQCFEKILELNVAGTKSCGTISRGNLMSRKISKLKVVGTFCRPKSKK